MTGHSCSVVDVVVVVVGIILRSSTRAKAYRRSRLEFGNSGVKRREPKGLVVC